MNISLTRIEGSDFVTLTDDTNFTSAALEEGTILLESDLMAIPEVKALTYGDVVLDIGAFIGDTAIIFGCKGAVVHAYEAQFDAYVAAVFNTRNYPNIIIHHSAVGDGRPVGLGEGTLDDLGNLGTRMVTKDGAVPTLSMDSLCLSRVTFVKLDIEGFEPVAIRGMMETLKKHMPLVICEIFPEMLESHGFSKEDIFSPMEALGYQFHIVSGVETDRKYDVLFTRNCPRNC